MKRNAVLLIVFALITVGLIAGYHVLFSKKIAFVDLNKVYDKFVLKEELEKKMESVSSVKKNILDSLKMNLELNYKRLQAKGKTATNEEMEVFNYQKNEYYMKTQNFEESNQQMLEQYDKQIWTQLNQFVRDYGKEQKLDLIVGGNGSGTVMYGSEAMDLTDAVIVYVNDKSKGGK